MHVTPAPVEILAPLALDSSMWVSGAILVLTFAGIFTEGLHHFHRTKVAMLGAALMVVAGQSLGFYDPERAIEAIDWNVIFLLGSMMLIIAIMIPTGGFQALAFWTARVTGGNQFALLVVLGTLVTVLSLLLDNVTTVVIFGPLIVLICQVLGVSPIPYLLAAALLSDTGGVATLVGDPPNLMIGSAAGIDFNSFFLRMGGVVLAAWIATLLFLRVLFWRELSVKPAPVQFNVSNPLDDSRTWYQSLVVLGVMVVLFIFHRHLHWEAWVVAAFGTIMLFFLAPHLELDHYLERVEHALLIFFIALFVLVGGVEQSHLLQYLGQQITPFVKDDLLLACLALLWVSAFLSAAIDNIPFTAAMIPIILSLEAQGLNVAPLWWCLAMGVGMGGNGTHIGSTANVFILTLSERLAKESRNPALAITPGLWFRKGTPVMLLTLVICSLAVILFFDFFSAPIH